MSHDEEILFSPNEEILLSLDEEILLSSNEEIKLLHLNKSPVMQVELTPPSPGEVPVAIADLSTKLANVQKQSFKNWTVSQPYGHTVTFWCLLFIASLHLF